VYNHFFNLLEWFSVGLNLLFVIYIIREQRIGWLFGIVGSFLSIALFIGVKLYSEAILYSYYVVMGFYGWQKWKGGGASELRISARSVVYHAKFILVCLVLSLGLGAFFNANTDAQKPFADAFSTIFSFFATYLEAQKVLSAWLYWVVLNAFSIWLYFERGLTIYAGLMVFYSILSVVGYVRWKKIYMADKRG
jgi:nicotinamide mononucleotide transporter